MEEWKKMENLLSYHESLESAMCGRCGQPRIELTEDDALEILQACRAAKIRPPVLQRVQVLADWCAAKYRIGGRPARITME